MDDPIDDAGRADYRCREHVPSNRDLIEVERDNLIANKCEWLMIELLDNTYAAKDYGTLGQVVRYLVDGEPMLGADCINSFLTHEATDRVEDKE